MESGLGGGRRGKLLPVLTVLLGDCELGPAKGNPTRLILASGVSRLHLQPSQRRC